MEAMSCNGQLVLDLWSNSQKESFWNDNLIWKKSIYHYLKISLSLLTWNKQNMDKYKKIQTCETNCSFCNNESLKAFDLK